jgi:hypothetical protein
MHHMKKQTARERQISLVKEAFKKPMTEMEAQERIRKLIAKGKSFATTAKPSTSKKQVGNLASLGITSLGDPII